MSESESNMSPENLFKYDYVNEFIGLDMSLQMLKSGSIDVDFFKSRCEETIKKKGKLVLKFGEKYNAQIPAVLEEKVSAVDAIADKINTWVDEFLKDENGKRLDDLADIVKQGIDIVKPPKKTK